MPTTHPEALEGEILFTHARLQDNEKSVGWPHRLGETPPPADYRIARGVRREDLRPVFVKKDILPPDVLKRLPR
jgi:hypothetical protein